MKMKRKMPSCLHLIWIRTFQSTPHIHWVVPKWCNDGSAVSHHHMLLELYRSHEFQFGKFVRRCETHIRPLCGIEVNSSVNLLVYIMKINMKSTTNVQIRVVIHAIKCPVSLYFSSFPCFGLILADSTRAARCTARSTWPGGTWLQLSGWKDGSNFKPIGIQCMKCLLSCNRIQRQTQHTQRTKSSLDPGSIPDLGSLCRRPWAITSDSQMLLQKATVKKLKGKFDSSSNFEYVLFILSLWKYPFASTLKLPMRTQQLSSWRLLSCRPFYRSFHPPGPSGLSLLQKIITMARWTSCFITEMSSNCFRSICKSCLSNDVASATSTNSPSFLQHWRVVSSCQTQWPEQKLQSKACNTASNVLGVLPTNWQMRRHKAAGSPKMRILWPCLRFLQLLSSMYPLLWAFLGPHAPWTKTMGNHALPSGHTGQYLRESVFWMEKVCTWGGKWFWTISSNKTSQKSLLSMNFVCDRNLEVCNLNLSGLEKRKCVSVHRFNLWNLSSSLQPLFLTSWAPSTIRKLLFSKNVFVQLRCTARVLPRPTADTPSARVLTWQILRFYTFRYDDSFGSCAECDSIVKTPNHVQFCLCGNAWSQLYDHIHLL